MEFIKNLNDDEIRGGFFVQSDKKKVWNRRLEIWQELDRICRKHEIIYWAKGGTLLGAARHSGFIPWDSRMDFCMMRPDFNRFCDVVEAELDGTEFEVGQQNFFNCRIYHAQTTLLREIHMTDDREPQGFFIRIFPLDLAEDGTHEAAVAKRMLTELAVAMFAFDEFFEYVQSGGAILNDWAVIEKIHNSNDPNEQLKIFNICAAGAFDLSAVVSMEEAFIVGKNVPTCQKEWFRETIYLPFETIELPAPVDYDKVLTACYGDWRVPVRSARDELAGVYSADIPYRECLKLLNLDMILGKTDGEETA